MEHSATTTLQSHQKPIGSGFDAFSTAADVIRGIDLTGKTIIVTGGYAGIGLETVKTFAEAGAQESVVAAVVKEEKATPFDEAFEFLAASNSSATEDVWVGNVY